MSFHFSSLLPTTPKVHPPGEKTRAGPGAPSKPNAGKSRRGRSPVFGLLLGFWLLGALGTEKPIRPIHGEGPWAVDLVVAGSPPTRQQVLVGSDKALVGQDGRLRNPAHVAEGESLRMVHAAVGRVVAIHSLGDPTARPEDRGRVIGRVQRQARGLFEVVTLGGTLQVTPDHPFWVRGRGWVPARDLAEGAVLSNLQGAPVEVRAIRFHPEARATVYNLVVARDHTYAVGNDQTWVHNGGCAVAPVQASLNGPPPYGVGSLSNNTVAKALAARARGLRSPTFRNLPADARRRLVARETVREMLDDKLLFVEPRQVDPQTPTASWVDRRLPFGVNAYQALRKSAKAPKEAQERAEFARSYGYSDEDAELVLAALGEEAKALHKKAVQVDPTSPAAAALAERAAKLHTLASAVESLFFPASTPDSFARWLSARKQEAGDARAISLASALESSPTLPDPLFSRVLHPAPTESTMAASLTPVQQQALRSYVGDSFYKIYGKVDMRSLDQHPPPVQETMMHLAEALRAAPKYGAPVYRGVEDVPSASLEQWVRDAAEGKPLRLGVNDSHKIVFSSRKVDIAQDYAKFVGPRWERPNAEFTPTDLYRVVYVIEQSSGVATRNFVGMNRTLDPVLIPHDAEFDMVGLYRSESKNDGVYIYLRERTQRE